MILRPATMEDAQRLYDWRNDPVTRAASHQTSAIDFAPHVAWLEKTLANPARTILIAEESGIPVGTVRADHGDITELSWTVAPEARGRGVGKLMVLAAVRTFGPSLRAEVKRGNTASQKIALAAGFVLHHEAGDVLHFLIQSGS